MNIVEHVSFLLVGISSAERLSVWFTGRKICSNNKHLVQCLKKRFERNIQNWSISQFKENTKCKKMLTQNIQKIQDTMRRPNLRIIGVDENEDFHIKAGKNPDVPQQRNGYKKCGTFTQWSTTQLLKRMNL